MKYYVLLLIVTATFGVFLSVMYSPLIWVPILGAFVLGKNLTTEPPKP